MKVCLASALTRLNGKAPTSTGDLEDAPLGPLTLAAILERAGTVVQFYDLDVEFARPSECARDFPSYAAKLLASTGSDLFGFSTLCGSYPLTLRLAKILKHLRPECTIVLGGPQASVVDVPTIRHFPHIDFIVRGEAEESFPALVDTLNGGRKLLPFIRGLTWRMGDSVQRTPDSPLVENLNDLPLPAYHLYKDVDKVETMSIELGRGCPFACTFCSTNDFFRRRFRLKDPDAVIRQMRQLNDRYGCRKFSLVHDMFTVDRRRVVAFCEAMIASGSGFKWSCSARTDCVDRLLLELMAQAGCNGIFYGIESGSPTVQESIGKGLDVVEALDMVRHTSALGIESTASAITGFPDERTADFRETVGFLMSAASTDNVEVQLHLLAPLSGTPIAKKFFSQLVIDRTQSDISLNSLMTDEEWDWVENHRDIFSSFYHVPAPGLDRSYVTDASLFIQIGLRQLRWLLVALHQIEGHILDVFDEWRGAAKPDAADRSLPEFADFVAARYGSPAIQAIIEMHRVLWAHVPAAVRRQQEFGVVIAPSAKVIELSFDLSEWLDHLHRGSLREFMNRRRTVVAIVGSGYVQKVIRLHQRQAEILAWCDGARDCDEIARLSNCASWNQWNVRDGDVVRVILEGLAEAGVLYFNDPERDQNSEQMLAAD